ncbi:MAG: transposase [Clostridiales bacterium]|jgi:transposase|nr:transposase [Clostridiales bacterium]MDK2932744.1 transposase [Clostridiales bacterium]
MKNPITPLSFYMQTKIKKVGYRIMINVIDFTTKLLGLQGIEVIHTDVNSGTLIVFAKPISSSAPCPDCGKVTDRIHDIRVQCYDHLPIWGMDTLLVLPIRRFKCDCDIEHPFDETYDFIRKYQRQTIPYKKYIFDLCSKNTITNVCEIVDISHGRCQRIFNYYEQKHLDSKETKTVKYIGIDDIAVRKGHNYKAMVYNFETGEVIDIINGRTKEDVIEFFDNQTQEFKDGILGVAIDMSKSYCNAVLKSLPNAKPVIDRFHISQLFHKLVDDARKHIQNKVRKEEGDKDKVFGIRWALLKNFEDLEVHEINRLFEVCNEYPKLGECFALKEEFRKFFDITEKEEAMAFIDYFKEQVKESQIPELQSFTKTLDRWQPQILNYYNCNISNGPTEGFNHKVKNIKRRAYGFRNEKNFEIRVKFEFCA